MSEIDLLAAVGLEEAELRLQLAQQAEMLATKMAAEARARIPEDDSERAQYQAKANEVRRLISRPSPMRAH